MFSWGILGHWGTNPRQAIPDEALTWLIALDFLRISSESFWAVGRTSVWWEEMRYWTNFCSCSLDNVEFCYNSCNDLHHGIHTIHILHSNVPFIKLLTCSSAVESHWLGPSLAPARGENIKTANTELWFPFLQNTRGVASFHRLHVWVDYWPYPRSWSGRRREPRRADTRRCRGCCSCRSRSWSCTCTPATWYSALHPIFLYHGNISVW